MQYITQNSEIVDSQTGLIWQKDVQNNLTYEQALELAERVSQETGQAWRVPTIDELSSLVDRSRSFPASGFPDMPSDWFWSSSPDVGTADYAWVVEFKSGYVINDCLGRQYAVRLVRTCGDQNSANKAFNAATAAVEAYRAHEGGAWFAWGRMIRRNRYTIDPVEPRPDHLDEEKQRLHAAAVKAVESYAACDGVYPSDVAYSFADYAE